MRTSFIVLFVIAAVACGRKTEVVETAAPATTDTTVVGTTETPAEAGGSSGNDPIVYAEAGAVAVQVGAWRSEEAAETDRKLWISRGYRHAHVVKAGDESTGEIWFRVMLGRFNRADMADRLLTEVRTKYGIRGWVNPDVH